MKCYSSRGKGIWGIWFPIELKEPLAPFYHGTKGTAGTLKPMELKEQRVPWLPWNQSNCWHHVYHGTKRITETLNPTEQKEPLVPWFPSHNGESERIAERDDASRWSARNNGRVVRAGSQLILRPITPEEILVAVKRRTVAKRQLL